jgi:hypothetical protein
MALEPMEIIEESEGLTLSRSSVTREMDWDWPDMPLDIGRLTTIRIRNRIWRAGREIRAGVCWLRGLPLGDFLAPTPPPGWTRGWPSSASSKYPKIIEIPKTSRLYNQNTTISRLYAIGACIGAK